MHLAQFTFNPFSENTYILYDDTKECVIVDPGCMTSSEEVTLSTFISSNDLRPTVLFNTHCHIDHILGNTYVANTYKLKLTSHKGEQVVLDHGQLSSQMYGIPYDTSPNISIYVDEGDVLTFGNTELKILFTPGHSPASISLYHAGTKTLIAGDVLFYESIGRTDLPGGDMDTLLDNIKKKLFTLPDDTKVYPGHGPSTTIGHEKAHNPFLQ